MKDEEKRQFGATIEALLLPFGRQTGSALLESWWVALYDLPLQAVQEAAHQALRECEYPPAPATIRRLAGVSGALVASEAWQHVVDQIRAIGTSGRDVDLTPQEWEAVKRAGGWHHLCLSPSDVLHSHHRKKFEQAFEAPSEPTSSKDLLDSVLQRGGE